MHITKGKSFSEYVDFFLRCLANSTIWNLNPKRSTFDKTSRNFLATSLKKIYKIQTFQKKNNLNVPLDT